MKVAYIFHGHSRTWQQCHESFFNNIFSILPGDIFIHTWDRVSPTTGSHWNGWNDLKDKNLEIANTYADISGIYQTYKPKVMIVEPHPTIDISWCDVVTPETKACVGVKYMLYSSRKSYEESLKHGNYDYYVSTRLDIKYTSRLNLKEINSNYILTPNVVAFDIFMFGPKNLLDIKTNFYNFVDQYWFRHESFPDSPYETALLKYMNDYNIPMKNLTLQFKVIRPF